MFCGNIHYIYVVKVPKMTPLQCAFTLNHNIKCTLDLHPNQIVLQLNVANTFNSISKGVIFPKLHARGGNIQFIPIVRAFYVLESPMFYSHHNHEGDVIVIPFAMGIHQCDPLGKALFVLSHFRVFCSTTSCFLSCLFSCIANDTLVKNLCK